MARYSVQINLLLYFWPILEIILDRNIYRSLDPRDKSRQLCPGNTKLVERVEHNLQK